MTGQTVRKSLLQPLRNERGVTAVLVSIMLLALLGMAALAIDVGHALVARNELQNAGDAAALAGARALGQIYQAMPNISLTGYTLTGGEVTTIVNAAMAAAASNAAAGVTITVNAGDIAIGQWNPVARTLTPSLVLPRAVRVITRRDGLANGPVSTFLARVIGRTTVNVNAVATAELTSVGAVAPGDMDAPFAIAQFFFSAGNSCGSTIQFSPSIPGNPQTCAGWTSYDQGPFNNNTLVQQVNGMANGSYEAPAGAAGETSIETGNGNLGNPAWTALTNLWQTQVANNGAWNALVPVYAGSDCSPSGAQLVTGFASMRITYVGGPGDPGNAAACPGANVGTGCITGVIQCDVFEGAGGGGGSYGTFGTIPGLVE
jgi:Flp pilus assembly protein TadG